MGSAPDRAAGERALKVSPQPEAQDRAECAVAGFEEINRTIVALVEKNGARLHINLIEQISQLDRTGKAKNILVLEEDAKVSGLGVFKGDLIEAEALSVA